MKRTKITSVLLILLLTISLVITATPASAQSSDVTLTMWTFKQFHMPGMEAIGKAFTAKTGIKVNFQVFNPDDAYRTKVQAASQSGDLPDVLAWWSDGQWDLASSGLLAEMTTDVDKDWQSTFLPGTYETTSVWTQRKFDACAADKTCQHTNLKVGQSFSVPFAAGSFYIVYANRNMLKQAGVDPSVAPKDTNDFLDMMDKVKKATGKAATIGGKFQDITRNWIVTALGVADCGPKKWASMINGDPSVSFTDPCSSNAFKFIGDITTRDLWLPGFQTLTIDQSDVAFAQGQAAFDFGGTFNLGFILQQGMKPEDIVTFVVPPLPSTQQKPIDLAPMALIDLAVTSSSQHVKEAKEFVKFFTSPDQMAGFAKNTNDLPAVKVPSDPAVVGDLIAGMTKYFQKADSSPLKDWNIDVVAGPDVWTAIDAVTNKQITGEGKLPDLLAAADTAARADVARRNGN